MENNLKNEVKLKETYTITEIANVLNVLPKDLNLKLAELNLQHKNEYDNWVLNEELVDKGYAIQKSYVKKGGEVVQYLLWSLLGREFIFSIFANDKSLRKEKTLPNKKVKKRYRYKITNQFNRFKK